MIEPNILLISSLRVSDLEKYAVWRFANGDETDDTAIRPVKRLPVSTLTGRFVGTRVRLASGDCLWGIVGNLGHPFRVDDGYLAVPAQYVGPLR